MYYYVNWNEIDQVLAPNFLSLCELAIQPPPPPPPQAAVLYDLQIVAMTDRLLFIS